MRGTCFVGTMLGRQDWQVNAPAQGGHFLLRLSRPLGHRTTATPTDRRRLRLLRRPYSRWRISGNPGGLGKILDIQRRILAEQRLEGTISHPPVAKPLAPARRLVVFPTPAEPVSFPPPAARWLVCLGARTRHKAPVELRIRFVSWFFPL